MRRFLRASRACRLGFGLLIASATPSLAQDTARSARAVAVRQLRLEPLLVASGLDSARLREAVAGVLRSARRLGQDTTVGLALDLDISVVPTPGEPLPQASVRVEVGRNRMERGLATRLAWDRVITTGEYPTFRALAAALPGRVVELIGEYVGRGGAGATRQPLHTPIR